MREIPGFERFYAATEDGRIFSKKKNRFLNPHSKSWYLQIRLCGKPFKVHRIIAMTFIHNDNPDLSEVNHKNGIKTDNRVINLEWCNRSQNIKHSYSVLDRRRTTGADHPKHIPILNTSTGIFYDSCKDAANALGVSRNKVKCSLFKHRKFQDLLYV